MIGIWENALHGEGRIFRNLPCLPQAGFASRQTGTDAFGIADYNNYADGWVWAG
jgi:hypothetical protein